MIRRHISGDATATSPRATPPAASAVTRGEALASPPAAAAAEARTRTPAAALYFSEKCCVGHTVVPNTKLCAWGEEDSGGHVQ